MGKLAPNAFGNTIPNAWQRWQFNKLNAVRADRGLHERLECNGVNLSTSAALSSVWVLVGVTVSSEGESACENGGEGEGESKGAGGGKGWH